MTNDDPSKCSDKDDRQSAIAMVATSSQRLPDITVIKRALGLRSTLAARLFSKVRRHDEAEQWDQGVVMLQHEDAQIDNDAVPSSGVNTLRTVHPRFLLSRSKALYRMGWNTPPHS